MRRLDSDTDVAAQACAWLVTALMLFLVGRVLLRVPEAAPSAQSRERMQIRFLERDPLPLPARSDLARVQAAESQMPVAHPTRSALPASAAAAAPPAAPSRLVTTPPVPDKPQLFDESGRIKVAIDGSGDLSRAAPASHVFEHRDPLQQGVGERATAELFSGRAAGTKQSRAQRWIYGRDVQLADARRPPEVAFNPALHERPKDLGSEATGDAYKAAPIRFEKVPDMAGEASRRIRASIGDLEKRYGSCSAAARQRWMAPVLKHLDELQRVEYSFNHGADPVAAESTLPAAADSAYDLARRGLWYAERQMATCRS